MAARESPLRDERRRNGKGAIMFEETLGLGSLIDRFPRLFRGEEPRCDQHLSWNRDRWEGDE